MTDSHWRNSAFFAGGKGLEALVEGRTYDVEFESFGQPSRIDGQLDPKVKITGPSGTEYFGFVSFNPARLPGSNEVRQRLIDKNDGAGPQKVRVFRSPKSGDPIGPYLLHGLPEQKFDFTPREAFTVVHGEMVYFAICTGFGAGGDPQLVGYSYSGDGSFERTVAGFLKPVRSTSPLYQRDRNRGIADTILTEKIVKEVSPGNKILVLDATLGSDARTRIFVPFINFAEGIPAYDGRQRQLVTRYMSARDSRKPLILDLPIINTESFARYGECGIGYVHFPSSKGVTDFYKPVFVTGAADLKGKYVNSARVVEDFGNLFLAKLEH